MAIPCPAELPLVTYEALLGDVILDDQPLDTILDAANFLYAAHTPPLWNLCPINLADTHTHDWVWPARPSADALTYDIIAYLYGVCGGADNPVAVDLRYGPTSAGAWTGVAGWTPKAMSLGGGGATEGWATATAALPAGAAGSAFWKLEVDDRVSSLNTQIQAFCAIPDVLGSITSGAKASGFIPYDSTMLLSVDGGTIHTELFERALANLKAVLRDRHQMVFSYVDELTVPNYTFAIATGRNATDWSWVFRGKTSVAGQGGGPGIGAKILVQVRADDTSAGGDGVIVVGEEGGKSVELACDDADNDDVIELQSDTPVFYAQAHPYASGGAVSIRYITGRWLPGDDT